MNFLGLKLIMQPRPHSQRNAIVPFHLCSTFWKAKDRLFIQEWNDCISVFVSVHTGTQTFLSTVFSLPFFTATTTSTHALRAKILSFHLWTSLAPQVHLIACSHRNIMERLCIIPLFVSLILSCSVFWNGTMFFQTFWCERNRPGE